MDRPAFLYHGSPVRLDRLEPRPARGVGPEHDMLTAVYATHHRAVAIAFALGSMPDEEGHVSWTLDLDKLDEGGHPRIVYTAGGPRLGATGYVYIVPSDTFEPVDDRQWVSFVPVTPASVEAISVDEYLHWVTYEGKA